MATATENLYLGIPKSDLSFLRKLAAKMGWTIKREPKNGIEKGLDDIEAGRVYEATDANDMIKQILG